MLFVNFASRCRGKRRWSKGWIVRRVCVEGTARAGDRIPRAPSEIILRDGNRARGDREACYEGNAMFAGTGRRFVPYNGERKIVRHESAVRNDKERAARCVFPFPAVSREGAERLISCWAVAEERRVPEDTTRDPAQCFLSFGRDGTGSHPVNRAENRRFSRAARPRVWPPMTRRAIRPNI